MTMLLGFTPFLAFFVGIRRVSPLAGLVAAMAIAALLCLRMWRRGETVKVLELGTLVLFGALAIYTVWFRPAWTVPTVRLAVDIGLCGIALVSMLIGKPFTLQYARERVAREHWGSPLFLRVNRHITLAWAAAFGVLAGADAAAAYVSAIPLGVDVAASVTALGGAALFTARYPEAARRRLGRDTSAGPASGPV